MKQGQSEISATPLDLVASGTLITLTAHEGVAFGDVCYINSSGEAALSDASAIATSSVVLMCAEVGGISADAAGKFLLHGIARNDAWSWTVGGIIYLSTDGSTGSTLTQTAPSGANEVIQVVGIATHADRMYFNPQLVQVEHV